MDTDETTRLFWSEELDMSTALSSEERGIGRVVDTVALSEVVIIARGATPVRVDSASGRLFINPARARMRCGKTQRCSWLHIGTFYWPEFLMGDAIGALRT